MGCGRGSVLLITQQTRQQTLNCLTKIENVLEIFNFVHENHFVQGNSLSLSPSLHFHLET